MNKILNVSPSPHQQSPETTRKLMFGVVAALIPALVASIYYFGMGAIIVTLTSVLSCVAVEYLIQKFLLKVKPSVSDGSAIVTGLLLAFNVPSNLPVYIIIIGAVIAIGVAKMTFGGLGSNPFNPALVGRVFLLISFPVQMTSWPVPSGFKTGYLDAVTGATPLGILGEGVKNGEAVSALMDKIPTHMQLFYGYMGGSMGEVAAAALILGGLYLIWRKIITPRSARAATCRASPGDQFEHRARVHSSRTSTFVQLGLRAGSTLSGGRSSHGISRSQYCLPWLSLQASCGWLTRQNLLIRYFTS